MATTQVHKRTFPGLDRLGRTTMKFSGNPATVSLQRVTGVVSEELTSEDHPYWHILQRAIRQDKSPDRLAAGKIHPFRNKDAGGPFSVIKRSTWISHPYVRVENLSTLNPRRFYEGPMAYQQTTSPTSTSYPAIPIHSVLELNAVGTACIAATLPTNPASNLATTLGELRNDGLPSIPSQLLAQSVLKRYRTARKLGTVGSEYLNVVFGWAPLISDSKKLATAVMNSKSIIEQFERDSGRHVRRKMHLPDRKTVSDPVVLSTATQPFPGFHNTQILSLGTLTKQTTTVERTWFSACYTYYLNTGTSAKDKLIRQEQIANKLLGHRINPEVLWELTPWSWAADWVTNIGEIMTNLSALSRDSLVIRYAYVMRETRATNTYTYTGVRIRGVPEGPITQSFTSTTKTRVKATPYGFGLNIASFTTKQWAILVALGISRGGNKL